jgi:nucleoside-diphosphate-sugar epimerase
VKALVTGANGFLGVALVERLLSRDGADVRCLVRSGSSRGRLAAVLQRLPGGELFVGSLASKEAAAEALEGVDVVYHLAAALKGAPADMFLNTVVTSRNLLDAVAASGRPIKLVFVSSFSVYGVGEMSWGSLLNESSPLETHAQWRDAYAQVKLRQERLFVERAARDNLPLIILRPGVIYGPAGSPFSNRVGLRLPGLFLHIGGGNRLPLSHVDNCAEAIAVAAIAPGAVGQVYNVLDDDLITARRFLKLYKKNVGPVRSLFLPYPLVIALSYVMRWYHRHSRGQLPAVLTPYRVAATWKRTRFDNSKLKSLGWKQLVPTAEGLRQTFEALRQRKAAGERLL